MGLDSDVRDDRSRFTLKGKRCGVHRVLRKEDEAANEAARHPFRL